MFENIRESYKHVQQDTFTRLYNVYLFIIGKEGKKNRSI